MNDQSNRLTRLRARLVNTVLSLARSARRVRTASQKAGALGVMGVLASMMMRAASLLFSMVARNTYTIECVRPDGTVRWREVVPNLVVNEGLDFVLDTVFKGSGYTASWSVGLIDNAGFTAIQAGDTAAKMTLTANPPTTNSWQELDDYDEASRQALTLGTVSGQSVDNSASKAQFSINASVTIKGAFVATASAKGATSGTLYGAAAFPVARSAESGDTLNVTCTLTQASA